MEEGEAEEGERKTPIFRDVRRYFCEYCGICRSKKSLISSHLLSKHQDEIERKNNEGTLSEDNNEKLNTCHECGACFQKPAHLKQHMLSHSLERSFSCPIDDCHSSYRRKDHLNRHLLQHQGKLFDCPIESCKIQFAFQGNITRHVNEYHCEELPSDNNGGAKEHLCPEIGCGKVFKYASKLKKHEASHVKLESVEAFCSEPSCLKYFTKEHYLKVHLKECHSQVICDVCGTKHLRKNIKRHMRTHERDDDSSERIPCDFEGCSHTFSTGDFEETDEMFRSRPRGGRKREVPAIETLMRKRVTPPNHSDSIFGQESEYLSWLLSSEADD
ncbi:transcription factor IIIA-like isoform X2 [Impatiens glandulifera]|uniref:transcription factor IIIA-like isoform X2 n=1 Tax=Impatiens glandulifera TaxID=253017 RepID=UPI001FB108D7|nr:transcription factor IIIA-like isoform X2 [Impatiens glandulifera]